MALVEIKSTERLDRVQIAKLAKLSLDFENAEPFIFCRASESTTIEKVQVLPWQEGLELLF